MPVLPPCGVTASRASAQIATTAAASSVEAGRASAIPSEKRRALIEAVKEDRIDVIATDHAPHAAAKATTTSEAGADRLTTGTQYTKPSEIGKAPKKVGVSATLRWPLSPRYSISPAALLTNGLLADW